MGVVPSPVLMTSRGCVLLSVRQFFCLFGLLTQLGAVPGRAQCCIPPLCLPRSQPTFAFCHQVGSHRNALHSPSWAFAAGGPIPLRTDTNTPLLSAQHTKASGTQSLPCWDLGINSHTWYFGTMPHFRSQCVKTEIFTRGISAVGRKFCSTFVFKVLKIKIWAIYHMVPNGSCHWRA